MGVAIAVPLVVSLRGAVGGEMTAIGVRPNGGRPVACDAGVSTARKGRAHGGCRAGADTCSDSAAQLAENADDLRELTADGEGVEELGLWCARSEGAVNEQRGPSVDLGSHAANIGLLREGVAGSCVLVDARVSKSRGRRIRLRVCARLRSRLSSDDVARRPRRRRTDLHKRERGRTRQGPRGSAAGTL